MKILPILRKRRTVRRFSERGVSRGMVRTLIRAGCLAPSAHDLRPWRVVAIDDIKVKERLADLSSAAYLRSLNSRNVAGAKEKAIRARLRLVRAPVILVVCLDRSSLRREDSYRRKRNEWIMATQSVSAMVQNILLQASAMGLAGCWRGVALFLGGTLSAVLDLPPSFEPQALVEVGYPSEAPRKRMAQPVDAVLRFNTWAGE